MSRSSAKRASSHGPAGTPRRRPVADPTSETAVIAIPVAPTPASDVSPVDGSLVATRVVDRAQLMAAMEAARLKSEPSTASVAPDEDALVQTRVIDRAQLRAVIEAADQQAAQLEAAGIDGELVTATKIDRAVEEARGVAPKRSARARVVTLLTGSAGGAIGAQLSQALASFALQVAAAHILGVRGLGVFALLYGTTILATAICTGLVGDSLTVLDRSAPTIRAALQAWCLIAAGICAIAAAAITWAAGLLTPGAALLFALATAVFVVEDALRRMLMAVARFWSLPLVDITSLIASLLVLVAAEGIGQRLTVGTFMFALLIGQIVASIVAVLRFPRSERHLAPWTGAELSTVFHFGFWRSAAQSVRPATLTAVRVAITAIAGVAVYGHLEAARVYMAPALLIVNGIGSFLLPMYVRRVNDGAQVLVRRADRAALSLLASSLIMGVIATSLVPVFGTIVTGHGLRVSALAVFGWSVYAASCAAVMPYGSLAAVLGAPSKIMVYRVVEAAVSIGAVMVVAGGDLVSWAPLAMSAGPFIGGYGIRRWVLMPIVRTARVVAEAQARPVRDPARHAASVA